VYAITLLVNVPLSIALIATWGVPGAAAALAISEFLQAAVLWYSASQDERALVGRALATAVSGAAFVVVTAVALAEGSYLLAALGVLAAAAVIIGRIPWMHRQRVVVS
jgi:peptidoglycan biosynthesis protein MviN/MurJ (putative lipid II flippase)